MEETLGFTVRATLTRIHLNIYLHASQTPQTALGIGGLSYLRSPPPLEGLLTALSAEVLLSDG